MERVLQVRVAGPLAGCVSDLVAVLEGRGYTAKSVVIHLRRLSLLSRWLERDGLPASAVDEGLVETWLGARHEQGKGRDLTARSFRLVLDVLRGLGEVEPRPAAVSPVSGLLADYERWLVVDRALMGSTVAGYVVTARWFLAEACGNDPAQVAGLSAEGVARFVASAGRVRSPRSLNEVVVGVRSLLRYLYQQQLISTPLAQAAPWLAQGRHSTLPRTLPAGTAGLLAGSCDRASLAGARDFAVITVLARLGLRVGEVVAMELGDLDWATWRAAGGQQRWVA